MGIHPRTEEVEVLCLDSEGQWLFPSPVIGPIMPIRFAPITWVQTGPVGTWQDRVSHVPPPPTVRD
jgi:hypothetical protein